MTARRRAAYHHGDLANALVDAAYDLVAKRGLMDFSLREAATVCGVAVSSAYKHFASRDELLLAVADRGFAELAARMEARVKAATRGLEGAPRAEAALFQLGRAYIQFAAERPWLFRLMYGPIGPRGGGDDRRPDAPARRLSMLLARALAEVRGAYGTVGDPHADLVIAWSIVHGFSMMVIDGVWRPPGRKAFEDMIAAIGQAVLRSLR